MNRWTSLLKNAPDAYWKIDGVRYAVLPDHSDCPRIYVDQAADYSRLHDFVFFLKEERTLFGRRFTWFGEICEAGRCIGLQNIPQEIRDIVDGIIRKGRIEAQAQAKREVERHSHQAQERQQVKIQFMQDLQGGSIKLVK